MIPELENICPEFNFVTVRNRLFSNKKTGGFQLCSGNIADNPESEASFRKKKQKGDSSDENCGNV